MAIEQDEANPNEFKEIMDYKNKVDNAIEDVRAGRVIKRKQSNPKANRRDYDQEDLDFGANEIDLVM